MIKKITFMLVLLSLTGCGHSEAFPEEEAGESIAYADSGTPEVIPVSSMEQHDQHTYTLYNKKDDYTLSLYEPPEGCYLGAYILSNKKINFDMQEFDRLTGKEHNLFMYNTKLGDPFPTNWILSCIAQMKTPYIVIMPPNDYRPFDESLLVQTAKEFGEYYIPIFVDFYPFAGRAHYESEEYKAFYQKAREVFAEYASNTAFVWSASKEDVFDAKAYYPGDHAVDWVGLSLYQPVQSQAESEAAYEADVFNKIDYFYYTFQKNKPLMISQLAVSHYTGEDHIYRTKEAAAELTGIYDAIIRDYPRIKAIIYMDFNEIELSPGKPGGNNFSITDESTVREAYGNAISNEKFLSRLDMASSGDKASQLIKSPFPAVKWEDRFYISEKTLTYDLDMKDLNAYQSKMIGGLPYFELFDVEGLKKSSVEEAGKRIIFHSIYNEGT